MSWGLVVCSLLLGIGLCLGEGKGTNFGQECGDNPMKQVLMVAKRTGRTLTHVLTVLRDIDSPAYQTLANKFRMYAACVGLVDTGYFRKRGHAMALRSDADIEQRVPMVAGKGKENVIVSSVGYRPDNTLDEYYPSSAKTMNGYSANSGKTKLEVASRFLDYLRRIEAETESELDENSRYQRDIRDPELMQYVPS